ncbi:hypothetical protein GP486_000803 [Trichoglossum hirsutum]|uniref:Enoyl reductase (ER) domain-containing protein n=1 Tax=Trichoglossum hirsutum TaxID=265104 RepID=A0A9P8LI32_9PEZI|nr:hypothetical protein GP486_000803 [Trichoglossum hirsutum]
MVQNKGLIFKSAAVGWPEAGKNLAIEDCGFDFDAPPPNNGITTKNYFASFDPYQRGRMRDPGVKSYNSPFVIDKPITNYVIAEVLKSDNTEFKSGDLVRAFTGIEEYSVVPEALMSMVKKLENPYNLDLKLFLGPLGMPGLTAYSSFYEIGRPKKGEVIFISAASGAVGQIVGQLAKREGLTVLGSVGDDKKLEFIQSELGFDGGFNYKKENAADALARLCPTGIDIYYENVGGEQLDAALEHLHKFGRISIDSLGVLLKIALGVFLLTDTAILLVACGMISQYNAKPGEQYRVKNITQVVSKSLTIRGFIQSDPDMGPKYADDHQKNVQKWLSEGTLKTAISVTRGIDNSIDGLLGMFEGRNFGKAVLQIADFESST